MKRSELREKLLGKPLDAFSAESRKQTGMRRMIGPVKA